MRRTKIAPNLRLLLDEWRHRNGETDWLTRAERDLRALEAVASAAERDLDSVAEMLHLPRSTMEAVGSDTTAKLARSLRRLRSLSSPSKPRKVKRREPRP